MKFQLNYLNQTFILIRIDYIGHPFTFKDAYLAL